LRRGHQRRFQYGEEASSRERGWSVIATSLADIIVLWHFLRAGSLQVGDGSVNPAKRGSTKLPVTAAAGSVRSNV
jgi:hypothetical protein